MHSSPLSLLHFSSIMDSHQSSTLSAKLFVPQNPCQPFKCLPVSFVPITFSALLHRSNHFVRIFANFSFFAPTTILFNKIFVFSSSTICSLGGKFLLMFIRTSKTTRQNLSNFLYHLHIHTHTHKLQRWAIRMKTFSFDRARASKVSWEMDFNCKFHFTCIPLFRVPTISTSTTFEIKWDEVFFSTFLLHKFL